MVIQDNIRDRAAAKELHNTIGELLADEVPKLPSDISQVLFFDMLIKSASKNLERLNQTSKPTKLTVVQSYHNHSEDVQEAYHINIEIQELAESVAWPDAPEVAEKAASIIDTVEKRNHVTIGQIEALRNMLEGMRAWDRD